MDDQVSQTAEDVGREALDQLKWAGMAGREQAATLRGLSLYLLQRRDAGKSLALQNAAWERANHLGYTSHGPSPIPWSALNDRELAERLREIAGDKSLANTELTKACTDVAHYLEHPRKARRVEKER